MSTSTFLPTDFPENHNPNPNYTYLMDNSDEPVFKLPNYLMLEDSWEEEYSAYSHIGCSSQTPIPPEKFNGDSVGVGYTGDTPTTSNINWENVVRKVKMDVGFRIAFRTKSELEVMDDGFKWRKYGKKKVKDSPYPRNYYRCSSRECHVKKRVERDREDSSYVITTYEGVHNHESPCVVYYNQMPLMVSSGWTVQASHSFL